VLNYAENKSHLQGPVLCSIVNYFFGLSGSVIFLVTVSQTGLLLGRGGGRETSGKKCNLRVFGNMCTVFLYCFFYVYLCVFVTNVTYCHRVKTHFAVNNNNNNNISYSFFTFRPEVRVISKFGMQSAPYFCHI